MNAYHKKQQQKKRKNFFRKWHRRLGFTAALLVVNLSITGILLNHYESFGLHQSYVDSDWLLNAYQIKSPSQINCFKAETTNACQLGELLYFNQQYQKKTEQKLLGLFKRNSDLLLITDSTIELLTNDLELIESIDFYESINEKADAAFLVNGMPILALPSRSLIYDFDMEEWEAFDLSTIENTDLSKPVSYQLSKDIESELKADYRTHQISHLTFIQDLHSGRVFGTLMIILNDVTAIILIILVISGFVAWQRRKNKTETPN